MPHNIICIPHAASFYIHILYDIFQYFLFLYTAQGHTLDNKSRQQQIYNNNGHDCNQDHHIYFAHIKFQKVRICRMANADGFRSRAERNEVKRSVSAEILKFFK